MLCQRCFKKQATVKLSQNLEGKYKEQLICKSCSKKYGLEVTISNLPQVFSGIILSILKHKQEDFNLHENEPSNSSCSNCGYHWEDFRKTGLLGCEQCYDSFHTKILTLQRQVINKNELNAKPFEFHRKDTKKNERAILERALATAVDREEYEKAAKIRDRIIQLGKNKEGN